MLGRPAPPCRRSTVAVLHVGGQRDRWRRVGRAGPLALRSPRHGARHTRAKGQKPDYNRPVVLRRGATLETLAAALHIEWMGTVKYAQVWGNGKFDGQHVSRTYVLEDGDTIELRM